jgi:hypothetical protein
MHLKIFFPVFSSQQKKTFFFFFFLAVVGFGLRALCLIGGHSTTWAMTTAPFLNFQTKLQTFMKLPINWWHFHPPGFFPSGRGEACMSVVLQLWCVLNPPRKPVQADPQDEHTHTHTHTQSFWFIIARVGLRMCLSNKFPGDVGAAETTLRTISVGVCWLQFWNCPSSDALI